MNFIEAELGAINAFVAARGSSHVAQLAALERGMGAVATALRASSSVFLRQIRPQLLPDPPCMILHEIRALLATEAAIRVLRAPDQTIDATLVCEYLENTHTTRGAAIAYKELLSLAKGDSDSVEAGVRKGRASIRDVAVLRCTCGNPSSFLPAMEVAFASR